MVLKKIAGVFGGDPHKREIEKLSQIVDEINSHEAAFEALSDEQLKAKTGEFKARLEDGETLDDLLPEAFAVVRETGKRTIGLRHYDIQMIGGMTLHKGRIAEMRTGEGKTLVGTLPVYLNAPSAHCEEQVAVYYRFAGLERCFVGDCQSAECGLRKVRAQALAEVA